MAGAGLIPGAFKLFSDMGDVAERRAYEGYRTGNLAFKQQGRGIALKQREEDVQFRERAREDTWFKWIKEQERLGRGEETGRLNQLRTNMKSSYDRDSAYALQAKKEFEEAAKRQNKGDADYWHNEMMGAYQRADDIAGRLDKFDTSFDAMISGQGQQQPPTQQPSADLKESTPGATERLGQTVPPDWKRTEQQPSQPSAKRDKIGEKLESITKMLDVFDRMEGKKPQETAPTTQQQPELKQVSPGVETAKEAPVETVPYESPVERRMKYEAGQQAGEKLEQRKSVESSINDREIIVERVRALQEELAGLARPWTHYVPGTIPFGKKPDRSKENRLNIESQIGAELGNLKDMEGLLSQYGVPPHDLTKQMKKQEKTEENSFMYRMKRLMQ